MMHIKTERKTCPPRHLWRTAQTSDCSGPREHSGAQRCDLPPAAGTPDKHDKMVPFWTPVHHSKDQQADLNVEKCPYPSYFWLVPCVVVSCLFCFGLLFFFCKQKYQDHEGCVVSSIVNCAVTKFRCRQVLHYLTCALVCFLPVLSNTFEANNGGRVQLLWKNSVHKQQIPLDKIQFDLSD